MHELINKKKNYLKLNNLSFFTLNPAFRLVDFFNLFFFEVFFKKIKKLSIINNFYFINIITRLSSIMNLCSNRLVIYNDYIYNTIK